LLRGTDDHPNVHFHFTPTSASWLNQVEIWFCIFTRKRLRDASFKCKKDLAKSIQAFIEYYNKNTIPFVWRKFDVIRSSAGKYNYLLMQLNNIN